MRPLGTGMAVELHEAPAVVQQQARELAAPLAELVVRLARRPPRVVVTCARGSSAHAATFAKHLIEQNLGIPVAAAAPNIATVYHRPLELKDQLFLAISQSGSSDDLIETAAAARAAGAVTAAIVNDTESPLATRLRTRPADGGRTRAEHRGDQDLHRLTHGFAAIDCAVDGQSRNGRRLRPAAGPSRTGGAARLERGARPFDRARIRLVAIGRGPTLAIAREAALKLKEICALHAEAFSSAEFLHGPIALVSSALPVLMFNPTDGGGHGLCRACRRSRPRRRACARCRIQAAMNLADCRHWRPIRRTPTQFA